MRKLMTACGRIVPAIGMVMIVTACATKTVESTTSENGGEAPPIAKTAPLKDFSRNPGEEIVKAPDLKIVAKADQEAIAARRAQEAAKREIGNIYFPFDRWGLTPEDRKSLLEDAEILKQNPGAKLVIEGYCDERGSREYNLVLGDKRAQEAMRYLAALGIRNPVKVVSYGEERPVCSEHAESCYWKNRRAHLSIDDGK